jgi:hypothetical protein
MASVVLLSNDNNALDARLLTSRQVGIHVLGRVAGTTFAETTGRVGFGRSGAF